MSTICESCEGPRPLCQHFFSLGDGNLECNVTLLLIVHLFIEGYLNQDDIFLVLHDFVQDSTGYKLIILCSPICICYSEPFETVSSLFSVFLFCIPVLLFPTLCFFGLVFNIFSVSLSMSFWFWCYSSLCTCVCFLILFYFFTSKFIVDKVKTV